MLKFPVIAAVAVLGLAGVSYADLSRTGIVSVGSTTGGVATSGVSGANLTTIDGVTGLTITNPGAAGDATVDFLLNNPAGPTGESTFLLFATSASSVTLTSLQLGTGAGVGFTAISGVVPVGLVLTVGGNRFVGTYTGAIGTFTTFRAVFTVPGGANLSIDMVSNPEPGTLALFALGAAGLGGFAMKRRNAKKAAAAKA